MNANVFDTRGKAVALAAHWGKPTMLFYEDKNSTHLNQALKDELFRRGRAAGLLSEVTVIGIANVAAYDWFPARNFVITAVRDVEERSGVPLYLDWKGVFSQPPWGLSAKGSTVVVVDRNGAILYSKGGTLSSQEVDDVFALLRQLVARP